MDKHGDEVKELCTKGGKTLFWSSNFSLGVAIFSAVNKYLAKIMNNFPYPINAIFIITNVISATKIAFFVVNHYICQTFTPH